MGYFELYQKVNPKASGFMFEIRPKGINEPIYGAGPKDIGDLLETLNRFDLIYGTKDQIDWRKFESGKVKFNKQKVKRLILSQYDNFEAIKKLKQYGVIQ
jgi:hypothetical protein